MMSDSKTQLSRRDFGLCAGGFIALLGASATDAVLNRGLNDPEAVRIAAERLNQIPGNIGPWTSSSQEIDEREKRLAGITESLRRTYRNSENGFLVSVTLLCGAAGPMCVHPPTACFEGVGYELSAGPTVVTFDSSDLTGDVPSALNRATFRLPDGNVSEVVRVFWGWSGDGVWQAPENPRLAFRGQPYLFKLYVVDRSLQQADDLRQAEMFMELALPEIRKALHQ